MMRNLVVLTILGIAYSRAAEGPPRNEVEVTFENGISNCEGYENKLIRTDKIYAEKVNKTMSGLAGEFEVTEDISGPLRFTLTIHQLVNGNWEYCCEFEEGDLCDSLKGNETKGKPWSPYISQLKLYGCPLSKGTYKFESTYLNTKGEFSIPRENRFYKIEVKFLQNEIELGCYLFKVKTQII